MQSYDVEEPHDITVCKMVALSITCIYSGAAWNLWKVFWKNSRKTSSLKKRF